MSKTEEWAKDKPQFISNFSIQLVHALNCFFDVTIESSAEYNPIEELIEYPNTKYWLSLYRKNKHITIKFISALNSSSSKYSVLGHLVEYLIYLPSNPQLALNYVSRSGHTFDSIQSQIGQLKFVDLDSFPEEVENALQIPKMLFLMKIIIPCTFLYSEHPTILYRKARQGDPKSIEHLLRIDKAVICDSRISEHIFRSSIQPNSYLFDHFLKALKGSPKRKEDRKKAKNRMAGFISLLSEAFDYRLTSQDIRKLFNAVAIDSDKDELLDSDLPDSEESFSLSINRARKSWNLPFHPIS